MAFDPQLYVRFSESEGSSHSAPFPRVDLPLSGDAVDEATLSYEEVIAYIPSRAESTILIQCYLDTVEGTHGLFHMPTLHQELTDFWSDPSCAEYDWLAQLFMILALGHQASGKDETQFGFSGSRSPSPFGMNSFILAAQICLKKAGYMLMAKNTIIRALSLMAIVIQTSGYSCRNLDACGPWLDIAIRHCMRLGYHKLSSQKADASNLDRYLAKRIWTTVAYLQLQQSMKSGAPLLLRPSDVGDDRLANIDDEDVHPGSSCYCPGSASLLSPADAAWTEGTYQILLAKSLGAAVDIVSQVNCPLDDRYGISYECTLRYDAFFRGLLRLTASIYDYSAPPMGDFRDTWRRYQRLTLETFFRRILLILHQPFGQRAQTHHQLGVVTNGTFPSHSASHWTLLECSLAILVAQRQMLEEAPSDGPFSTTRQFYEELLKQDFFIAALFAGIQIDSENYLLQHREQYQSQAMALDEAPNDPESNGEYPRDPHLMTFIKTPPRETITLTLRCCQSIWARSLRGNPEEKCNIWVYLVLGKMIDMLNTAPGCLVGNS